MEPARVKSLVNRTSRARSTLTVRLVAAIIRRIRALLSNDGFYHGTTAQSMVDQVMQLMDEAAKVVATQSAQLIDEFAADLGVTLPTYVPQLPPPQQWESLPGQFRYHVSEGDTPEDAEQKVEQVAEKMVERTLSEASDQAIAEHAKSLPKIIGFRRVVHPELSKGGTCGLCIAAAHRVYKVNRLEKVHDGCHCGVLPVFKEDDPGEKLNGEMISDDLLQDVYDAADGYTSASKLSHVRLHLDADGNLQVIKPAKDDAADAA